jgi:hypothetical protein
MQGRDVVLRLLRSRIAVLLLLQTRAQAVALDCFVKYVGVEEGVLIAGRVGFGYNCEVAAIVDQKS